MNLLAKLTAISTILTSVMMVTPVSAAPATSMKDTMDRLKVSVTGVTHTVTMALPAGGLAGASNTLTLDYNTAGFTSVADPTSATCTAGDVTHGASGNVITITRGSADCTGTLTVVFTAANPSSAGSKTISLGGTGGITGSYAIAIVDDDQVSVTASVDPSLTFDLDTGTAVNANNGAPYSVALGTLSTSTVKSSGDGTINMIGVDLATNASSGAVVTVKSANAALKSTSTPADTIPAVGSTTLVAGTVGYGICVNKVTAGTSSQLDGVNFEDATLTANATSTTSTTCTATAHQLGSALTTGAQNILDTNALPAQGGRAELFVKAAISAITPAHSDYTDTLTFVATATF